MVGITPPCGDCGRRVGCVRRGMTWLGPIQHAKGCSRIQPRYVEPPHRPPLGGGGVSRRAKRWR